MNLENMFSSVKKFVKNNPGFCVGVAALATAGFADVYATSTSIKEITQESNPIGRYLFENFGVPGLATFKIALISGLIYTAKETKNNFLLTIPSIFWSFGALSWYC